MSVADSELDALRTTVEESNEINGELSAALAVLAGESLKPCVKGCPGHLGEKAGEAMTAALDAWRALQAGNVVAAARIAELEAELLEARAVSAQAGPAAQETSE